MRAVKLPPSGQVPESSPEMLLDSTLPTTAHGFGAAFDRIRAVPGNLNPAELLHMKKFGGRDDWQPKCLINEWNRNARALRAHIWN